MIRRLGNAMLATGSSQIFWYLSLPFIGKLYSHEDVGLYSQVIAYAATAGLVIGARSDLAVLTARTWRVGLTGQAFEKLAALLVVPVGLILLVVGYASTNKVLEFPLILAVLLGAILSNLFVLGGVSLVKANDYSSLRNSGLLRSGFQAVAQLSLPIFGLWGLIAGKLLGDFLGVMARRWKLRRFFPRMPGGGGGVAFPFRQQEWAVIKRNAPAFKYSLPQSLISSLSQNAPYFLLPISLMPDEMGQFAMAFALVVAPVGLVGAPIRQTFIAHLSGVHKTGARALLLRSTAVLTGLGLVGYIALYLAAPYVVPLVLGESWAPVTDYMRVLAGWSAIGVASIPSVAYLLSRERNRLHLQLEAMTAMGRVSSLLLGVFFLERWLVLVPFVVVSIFFLLATILVAVAYVRRDAGS